MACDITSGRDRLCKETLGGSKKLWLFNYIEDPFTVTAGQATAVNAGLTQVFEYELEGDNNSLIQDPVGDENTGTFVNTEVLSVQLKKLDAATNVEMQAAIQGRPMAVVQDRNGAYHAVGVYDGINFVANLTTGAAKADFNGYTLTGTAVTNAIAPILDQATVTAFLALVA